MSGSPDVKVNYDANELLLGYVCEDPHVELFALNRWYKAHGRAARILSVASGGDTCLVLSSQTDVPVSQVVCVDISVPQIHCCRLKVAAYNSLSLSDFMVVLCNPEDYQKWEPSRQQSMVAARTRIIDEQLLVKLPKDTQEYWKQNSALYMGGIHGASMLTQSNQDIAKKLISLNIYPPHLQNSMDAFKDETVWNDAWASTGFKKFPMPPAAQAAYSKFFGQVVKRLYESGTWNEKNSWWIRQVCALPPNLDPASAAPLYLQYHSKHANTSMDYTSDGLTEHCTKHVSNGGTRYDFVNTSNCLDSMNEDAAHAMLTAIHAAMEEGGVFVARTLHIKTPDYLPALIAKYFQIDQDATEWATKNEQTQYYKTVVIAIKTTKQ